MKLPALTDYNSLPCDIRFIQESLFSLLSQPMYCTPTNQGLLMEFPWDWHSLVTSDLGVSEVGFRALLLNHPDMADDGYVDENNKHAVEVLKKKFHLESPELA